MKMHVKMILNFCFFRPGFRESAFQPIPKQETQDDKSTIQIKKQGKN